MYIKKEDLLKKFSKEREKYNVTYVQNFPIEECLKAKLTPAETTCLLILFGHNSKKVCKPSQGVIALQMDRSIRSINRYIQSLKQKGLIKVQRMGKYHNNHYDLSYLTQKIQKVIEKNKEDKKVAENLQKKANSYASNYKKRSTFCDYEQRTYDFENIEKRLVFGIQEE
ncbi:hypothetical protein C3495_14505 (plasmid) [Clostridiaceae bacterium 14S0207]|nr:hypothetical protein C3495_14505 [Clostridiaceae bacterium 14S0207]